MYHLVDLFPETKSQLTWHGPGERDAKWLSGVLVGRREERVALGNGDGMALRVNGELGIAVFAHQDGVAESAGEETEHHYQKVYNSFGHFRSAAKTQSSAIGTKKQTIINKAPSLPDGTTYPG